MSQVGLAYDPESHIYQINGVQVPSVTEILQSAGLIDSTWFTEESAWRGSCVHVACQLDDEGDLDESSVPAEVRGYLIAWRKFKTETGIREFEAIEQPIIAPTYAGTPDRVTVDSIIDLKSGSIQPWVGIQLAAYGGLISPPKFNRVAVALRQEGTYSVKIYPVADLRLDHAIFRAALVIHRWKGKNQ